MGTATSISTSRVFVPGLECVELLFTGGDTYKSKKFRKILGVTHGGLIGSTSTTDTMHINLGTSDVSTITIMTDTAATSLTTCVILWGIR